MSSRLALPVTPSYAWSLNTLQFWRISTNAAPRWAWARVKISTMP